MVEMTKRDTVKKKHDHWVHNIRVIYPLENVENMKKSWENTVSKCEEWLSHYDEYAKVATDAATQAFDLQLAPHKENIAKVDAMNDEEKLKYWKENFELEKQGVAETEADREKIIQNSIAQNIKLLNQYKSAYEEDMRNKKEALRLWNR